MTIRAIMRIIAEETSGEKYFLNFLSKGLKMKVRITAPKKALR
jgi:hypothetical protein